MTKSTERKVQEQYSFLSLITGAFITLIIFLLSPTYFNTFTGENITTFINLFGVLFGFQATIFTLSLTLDFERNDILKSLKKLGKQAEFYERYVFATKIVLIELVSLVVISQINQFECLNSIITFLIITLSIFSFSMIWREITLLDQIFTKLKRQTQSP